MQLDSRIHMSMYYVDKNDIAHLIIFRANFELRKWVKRGVVCSSRARAVLCSRL